MFCGASARIAWSVHLRRPRRGTPDYNETPVDGRALHVLKYIRRFYICPSPDRMSFARVFHLQAAKQCTKPDRLNRRAAAPAASAAVNVKTVTIRAFDGRSLHGLKFTLCICSVNFMFPRRLTAWHSPVFSTAERPVCVPYKRKGTTPDRMIPKKVGSKSARRERIYKRAAETRRDFFRRGGARQAGGCHAPKRGTELSDLCSDERGTQPQAIRSP